jgi:UDP-N-acetylglucosamine 2-epimerase (non-hydrolysing)
VGTSRETIVAEARRLLTDEQAYATMSRAHNPYGDGQAVQRIVAHVRDFGAARA